MRAVNAIVGAVRSVVGGAGRRAFPRHASAGTAGRRLKWALLAYVLICQSALPVATTFAQSGNQPPVITYFSVGNLFDDFWIFYGTVEDENPGYCIIAFGECMDGYLCGVEPDGSFCFGIFLDPSVHGQVTAVTRDDHNVESNVAYDFVFNYGFEN